MAGSLELDLETDDVEYQCTICSEPCEPEPIVSLSAELRGGTAGVWDFCSLKCLRYWTNEELPGYFDLPDEIRYESQYRPREVKHVTRRTEPGQDSGGP